MPNEVSCSYQLNKSISVLKGLLGHIFFHFYSNFTRTKIGDPDLTPHFEASDLGQLPLLLMPHKKKDMWLIWVNDHINNTQCLISCDIFCFI